MTNHNPIEQSLRQENMNLFEEKLRLENRINAAVNRLEDMIDGYDETKGRDGQVSEVIRILRGEVIWPNHSK